MLGTCPATRITPRPPEDLTYTSTSDFDSANYVEGICEMLTCLTTPTTTLRTEDFGPPAPGFIAFLAWIIKFNSPAIQLN